MPTKKLIDILPPESIDFINRISKTPTLRTNVSRAWSRATCLYNTPIGESTQPTRYIEASKVKAALQLPANAANLHQLLSSLKSEVNIFIDKTKLVKNNTTLSEYENNPSTPFQLEHSIKENKPDNFTTWVTYIDCEQAIASLNSQQRANSKTAHTEITKPKNRLKDVLPQAAINSILLTRQSNHLLFNTMPNNRNILMREATGENLKKLLDSLMPDQKNDVLAKISANNNANMNKNKNIANKSENPIDYDQIAKDLVFNQPENYQAAVNRL